MADEKRAGRAARKTPRVWGQGEYREKRGGAGRARFIAGCQGKSGPESTKKACLYALFSYIACNRSGLSSVYLGTSPTNRLLNGAMKQEMEVKVQVATTDFVDARINALESRMIKWTIATGIAVAGVVIAAMAMMLA